MPITVRRIITGHDKSGKAIVMIDETVTSTAESRPGANPKVIWTTEGFPVNNDGDTDESTLKTGTTLSARRRTKSTGPHNRKDRPQVLRRVMAALDRAVS